MRSSFLRQLRRLAPALAALYLPPAALLVFIALVSLQTGIHVSYFTRDPTAILQAGPFVGVLSNVGVLLWCAAAAICFFCAALLRRQGVREEVPIFFLVSGLFTLLLLVDDLFRLHDFILPTYGHISQEAFYAGYGVLAALYLVRFRGLLLKTDYLVLASALGALGLSVIVDVLPETLLPWHFLVEDGLKLLGIVGWAGYWAGTSFRAVRSWLTARLPIPQIAVSD